MKSTAELLDQMKQATHFEKIGNIANRYLRMQVILKAAILLEIIVGRDRAADILAEKITSHALDGIYSQIDLQNGAITLTELADQIADKLVAQLTFWGKVRPGPGQANHEKTKKS